MIGLFRLLFTLNRLGKVSSFSNQYIETSFLLFLIPFNSYFVNLNTKETVEIPLNRVSLKNHYISFILVFSGILFFVLMIAFGPTYSEQDPNIYLGYLPAIVAGLLIISGLIYSFRAGKPSKYEIKKRAILQSSVDINALPEWLSVKTAKSIFEKYKANLPDNWEDKIIKEDYTADEFFYYYTMLAYQNRIAPTNKNIKLLNHLDNKLDK